MKIVISALCLFCLSMANSHAGGSWVANGQTVAAAADDPAALHTDGSRWMAAPLVFDPTVSSESTGLFKANVPWDSQYDFFTFNPTYESLVLTPTLSSFGFEVAGMVFHGSGMITYPNSGSSISFDEHALNGGWFQTSVENDPLTLLNRTYADGRYILRNEGITTTYSVQAGDVLQIQNGIITAINP